MERLILKARLYDAEVALGKLKDKRILTKEGSVDEEIMDEKIADQEAYINNLKERLKEFDK